MKKVTFSLKLMVISAITIAVSSCTKIYTEDQTDSATVNDLSVINPAGFRTHARNLNVVYIIPNDVDSFSGFRNRLTGLLVEYQEFIMSEMNRNGYGDKTFGLPYDSLRNQVQFIMINANQNQDYYRSSGNMVSTVQAYRATHPEEFSSEHYIVFQPRAVESGLRQPFVGSGRFALVVDQPLLQGGYFNDPNSGLIAGTLHELGHGLNLPHHRAKRSEEAPLGQTIMWNADYVKNRGRAFFSKEDCAIFNRNEIFQEGETAGIYESATTTVRPKVVFDSAAAVLKVSGRFTSDKTVSDVLYWLDPNVNNEGIGVNRDYNSVAWYSNLIGVDSFAVNIPISDLTHTINYPYELKIKLLMENGSISEKIYDFHMNNGVPIWPTTAEFYQNYFFTGWHVSLGEGSYTTAQLAAAGFRNNDLSSIKVPLGYRVVLYDGDNFTGASYTVEATSISALRDYNDRASSLVISKL